jgi:hypothetical protein
MASPTNLSPQQAEELTVYSRRSIGEGFSTIVRHALMSSSVTVFGSQSANTGLMRRQTRHQSSRRPSRACVKIWRALWKVLAALGYCAREADPALGILNRAAFKRALALRRSSLRRGHRN